MYDSFVSSHDSIKNLCGIAQKSGLTGFCFVQDFKNTQKPKAAGNVAFGTEIGFEYETHERIALELALSDFDYTVNTVNTVDGINLAERTYYSARSRNEAYSRYLEKVFDSLDAAYDFSVIAAPAAVSLNTYYPSPALMYREFPDLLDSILMRTVFLGKGIELDASGFDVFGQPLPHESILRRYRELNGEIITVGSHSLPGRNIKKAYDLLVSCGFDFVTVFKGGKPEMIKL